MTMMRDEWVRAAMTDDRVVVELLVRLKQAQAAPPSPKSAVAALKWGWGIRQPRSRSMTMRYDAASHKKDVDSNISNRGSPTTPLSWSGGGGAASPSAADGFEETSRHVLCSPPAAASRSKGNAVNEIISATTKRSRRKKTFAELKEEENLLLKERVYLKREIATLRATFKEQRNKNENLKRIKLDLNWHAAMNSNLAAGEPQKATSSQPHQRMAASSLHHSSSIWSTHAPADYMPQPDSFKVDEPVSSRDSVFLLPDLNMMPSEDDSGAETLYGTS